MNIQPASTPLPQGARGAQKPWTILLYSAADNDMQAYNLQNIRDLETIGSDDSTNLVAQVDTGDACKRYLLQRATATPADQIESQPLETSGPVNMSDPKTLADFITWGMQAYPADHTMVIVSDHGSGWQGACEDDSANDWMSLPHLREAFEEAQQRTGKKVDIVGFDACLMASTEVAHELTDVCDYVIGSEDYEDSAGWPYTRIFNPELVAHLQQAASSRIRVAPHDLAEACVKYAAGTQDVLPTMSAISTHEVPQLSSALQALSDAIVASPDQKPIVAAAADASYPFDAFHDLLDFTHRLQAAPDAGGTTNPSILSAAARVEEAATRAIIAEQHAPQHTGAHGLTIEVSSKGIPETYGDTRFAQEVHWTDALTALQAEGTPSSSAPTA